MRTTLDIDDDVLRAAKELARRERRSAGDVISRLARQSLTGGAAAPQPPARRAKAVGGFRPFAPRGAVVSNEQIDSLRDSEGT
jgi:hypothetical protein